jgi:CRP/FNR family transcriptional regulator, anaerobic regulatory protein
MADSALITHLFTYLSKYVSITLEETEGIANHGATIKVKKKGFFLFPDAVCNYVGFVHSGCLEYYFNDNEGEKHIVYFAMDDWWVGDLNSFYNNKPTIYSLQALEDCVILAFNTTQFEAARSAYPAFHEFINQSHSRATAAVTNRFVEMKSLSAEERYLKLMNTYPNVFQRVPLSNIASYLGVKPQSLSRIRKQLSQS